MGGSQYTPLLDTACYSKCIRDLPSISDVHHHSGMQTFYHGCELFGASIFPQQLPQSSPTFIQGRGCYSTFGWVPSIAYLKKTTNGVKCLREVDKDNIQRSILLYALFLEFPSPPVAFPSLSLLIALTISSIVDFSSRAVLTLRFCMFSSTSGSMSPGRYHLWEIYRLYT